jgi:hypothetical protein
MCATSVVRIKSATTSRPTTPGTLPATAADPPEYNPFDNDNDDDSGGIAEAEPGQEDQDERWLPLPPQLDPNDNWSTESLYFSVYENTVEIMNHPKDVEALSYLLPLPPIYPP